MYIFKGLINLFVLVLTVYFIKCDDSAENIIEEMAKNITKDIIEEITRNITNDINNDVNKDITKSNSTKTLFECLKFSRSGRIVGGYSAKQNDLPYIVSLSRRGAHICGGTILNEKWLVTAAHCLCNGFNEIISTNNIKGIVGLHQLSEFKENTEYNSEKQSFQISFKNFVVHPDYKCTKIQNDIALLEIAKPLKFSDRVQPVCVDFNSHKNDAYLYDHLVATVSGWGWTNEDHVIGDKSDVLQSADVQIWDLKECQNSFKIHNVKVTEQHICAGYKDGGIDACWADSGGPLVLDDILIGVVSTGIGCARKDTPGIYTKVNEYVDWIEQVVT